MNTELRKLLLDWFYYYYGADNIRYAWKNCQQYIFHLLWKWAQKRHPRKSGNWIYKKYWKDGDQKKIFFLELKDFVLFY